MQMSQFAVAEIQIPKEGPISASVCHFRTEICAFVDEIRVFWKVQTSLVPIFVARRGVHNWFRSSGFERLSREIRGLCGLEWSSGGVLSRRWSGLGRGAVKMPTERFVNFAHPDRDYISAGSGLFALTTLSY